MVMHLDGGTRDHFMALLQREYPEMVAKYEQLYASKYVPKDYDEARAGSGVADARSATGLRGRARRPKSAQTGASSQARKQTRNRRGARHQRVDLDVLVQRVRAVADGAEAVERRHAERRGEVAVGAAAGAALFQRRGRCRRPPPSPARTT